MPTQGGEDTHRSMHLASQCGENSTGEETETVEKCTFRDSSAEVWDGICTCTGLGQAGSNQREFRVNESRAGFKGAVSLLGGPERQAAVRRRVKEVCRCFLGATGEDRRGKKVRQVRCAYTGLVEPTQKGSGPG